MNRLAELYPFRNNFLELKESGGTSSRIRYHYIDEGKGDPIVMLHGNPTWSFYYRNLAKNLRDKFRVIVPDHVGCGLSDKPPENEYDYTLKQRVDDLEKLLSHLGIENNITLIVHDWGGMIGMAYATRHPHAIKQFVILNTAGFRLPHTKNLPWQIWSIRNTPFGNILAKAMNLFSLGTATLCSEIPLPAHVKDAYLYPYNSWDNRVAVYNFIKDIPLKPEDRSYKIVKDVEENLHQFRNKPMLICWGKHDFVFDDHFLARWQENFPDAEVHYYPRAGHLVLEDAGDEIIPLIRRWLTKTSNIAAALNEMAERLPDNPAVIVQEKEKGYTQSTFKELDEKSDVLAYGLEANGIRRGTRTVLMVKPSLDFFALTFALFKIGAVPIMIDPGIGTKNLGKCLAEAEPEAFIGIPKAHLARIFYRWGRNSIRTLITVGKKTGWSGIELNDIYRQGKQSMRSQRHISAGKYKAVQTKDDEMAAILFTSGSTGIPKGAVYTHGIFKNQVKYLREVYRIRPGEKDVSTFPLFALFGPALGMTSIIPDMDASRPAQADPQKIIKAVKDHDATNIFASPALIRKVGAWGFENMIKLPSIKRVISAGAPARNKDIERFSKMLGSGVEIFTPYGATEALPVSNIGSSTILNETRRLSEKGKGNCVGHPVPGLDVQIIKITDEPITDWSSSLVLPDGKIGEIVVKGPIVTSEYYNREESTRLAKIPDHENKGFYHRMGDVGYKDDEGRIWFCGRKAHRVDAGGETLFTIPTEAIFNTHSKVFRTAIVGAKGKPVLCVELRDHKRYSRKERKQITAELLSIGASFSHTSGIKDILYCRSFPVDIRHNAKISREKLAEWAGRKV